MTEGRIRLLDSVGFTWKAPRGARRKYPIDGESATLPSHLPYTQSSSLTEIMQRMKANSCGTTSDRSHTFHSGEAAHNAQTSSASREQHPETRTSSIATTNGGGGMEPNYQFLTTIPPRIIHRSPPPQHTWHPNIATPATTACKSTQLEDQDTLYCTM
jgi:hypothetical protein